MPKLELPKTDDVTKVLKDALYVSVGLGVIAFQKAQVQRQELKKTFESQVSGARTGVDDRVKLVEERLDDIEARIDGVVDEFASRLPEQVQAVVKQTRQAAKDARAQVRALVGNGSN
jgi:ElaB/YqjD/DUF883 family membrane-anchored ribosome-binding protein